MPVKSRGRGKGDAVTLADLLAGVIFAALNAYAVLAGADFGGGVWALLARGPRKERQRDLIAHAIGPVWEANHVWLILAIVLLFTGFPAAFARLGMVLHIPLSLVLIGIVLRGSAFTFWRYGGETDAEQRHWGVTFAAASLITPLLLGVTVGAVAADAVSGPRAPGTPFFTGYVAPWLTPFALSGAALFGAALVVLVLSGSGAPRVRAGLILAPWAAPLHLVTAAAAVAALVALWRRRYGAARVAAAAQVSLILWGWGLSQYPYILPPDLTVAGAAAPAATLRLLFGALALGAVALLPSLYYLFRVFKTRTAVAPPTTPPTPPR